jgi:tetratricopeptide (TPR) repeat protein
MDARKAMQLANEYASKAMAIDPENSTTLVAMSLMRLYEWRWDECYELLQKAISINPNDAFAATVSAEYHLVFLQDDKVIESATLMCRLDPLSATTLGQASRYHVFLGQFDEAAELTEEAIALDPQNLASRNMKAFSAAMKGDVQKAEQVALETYRMAGNFPFVLLTVAVVYIKMGETEKVNEIVAKFEAMLQENPNANLDFAIALISVMSMNLEKFYASYNRALEKRSLLVLQCYGTVLMKNVWYDEHVVESRKKLGLPVKEENQRQ